MSSLKSSDKMMICHERKPMQKQQPAGRTHKERTEQLSIMPAGADGTFTSKDKPSTQSADTVKPGLANTAFWFHWHEHLLPPDWLLEHCLSLILLL